ncbi:MAG: 6-carboxytetrahydropterin synthase [Planctomycetota bacterium]
MFSITVEHEFCAGHAIVIAGAREPMHGHNFRVTAEIRGTGLDGDGLLCDFHTIEDRLRKTCAPFENDSLNEVAPFDRLNPTAEHLAWHVLETLKAKVSLPEGAQVFRVSVTEAPGCVATCYSDDARELRG